MKSVPPTSTLSSMNLDQGNRERFRRSHPLFTAGTESAIGKMGAGGDVRMKTDEVAKCRDCGGKITFHPEDRVAPWKHWLPEDAYRCAAQRTQHEVVPEGQQ